MSPDGITPDLPTAVPSSWRIMLETFAKGSPLVAVIPRERGVSVVSVGRGATDPELRALRSACPRTRMAALIGVLLELEDELGRRR